MATKKPTTPVADTKVVAPAHVPEGMAKAPDAVDNATALARFTPDSPDVLLAPIHPDGAKDAATPGGGIPYVGFRGKKSEKNLAAIEAAGVAVGEFYLHDVLPIAVRPLEVHVLQIARFFTIINDDMKITDVLTEATPEDVEDGFREHIFAVVAVRQPQGAGPPRYTAATMSLRSGQSKALQQAYQLLETRAADPVKWAAMGEKYIPAAKARVPGGRFRVRVWNTQEKPKGGGRDYNLGHGTVILPDAVDVEAFNTWVVDSWPRIKRVIAVHNARCAEAKKIADAQAAG